jgi:glycosyltransferase involved in cell wall biosynthesis
MYLSPLKLYEYMAMAKPVIASNFGDARDLIVDGQTGYLFRSEDKDSLKEILHKVYKNKRALVEMGHNARRKIVEQHSWTSRVSNLIQAVENIV